MAELNFGLLTPPGSQNIGNAFVQGMDQAAVARAQENQNALSQYTLSKARREDELTNQMLAGMQGATTIEEQANVLRRGGKYKEANELINAGLDRQIKQGTLAAQPGTAARVAAQTARDRQTFEGQAIRDLRNNPSDDNIRALAQDAVINGVYTLDQANQKVAEFLAIPLDQRVARFSQYGAPAVVPRQPNLAADLLIPGPDGTLVPNKALIGVKERLARVGAPNVTVRTEQAYSGAVATGAAKQDLAQIDRAQSLPQEFAKIDETLGILRNTDINTGLGADLFTILDKARAQVTADKKAGKRAVNTEYLDSLLGSAVFPQIQALGIGARGMDTPAEREFLRKVMTGTVGLTKDTLIQMTELRRKGLENESTLFNKRVEKGEFKPFEEAARRNVEAVTVPPLPTSAAKGAARPTGVGSDWTLMTDAKGNSAWVSPDRKSFKEAK